MNGPARWPTAEGLASPSYSRVSGAASMTSDGRSRAICSAACLRTRLYKPLTAQTVLLCDLRAQACLWSFALAAQPCGVGSHHDPRSGSSSLSAAIAAGAREEFRTAARHPLRLGHQIATRCGHQPSGGLEFAFAQFQRDGARHPSARALLATWQTATPQLDVWPHAMR